MKLRRICRYHDPYFTINFTFFFGVRPQLNIIFVVTKKDNVGSFDSPEPNEAGQEITYFQIVNN